MCLGVLEDSSQPEAKEAEDIEAIEEIAALHEALEESREQVSSLRSSLDHEKIRVQELWRVNCDKLTEFDSSLAQKDSELGILRSRLRELEGESWGAASQSSVLVENGVVSRVHQGKAPPVDVFTGEDLEILIDDWLPALQRISKWNRWTMEELLLQLAGHLKGRTLQEWSLLSSSEKDIYVKAVEALHTRLDPGSRILAAQDFRHCHQKEGELVRDFTRRLERTFQTAYGRDALVGKTRDTLLHGRLQEGLHFKLMKAPAVSEHYHTKNFVFLPVM